MKPRPAGLLWLPILTLLLLAGFLARTQASPTPPEGAAIRSDDRGRLLARLGAPVSRSANLPTLLTTTTAATTHTHPTLTLAAVDAPWWAGCELLGQGNRAAGRCMMLRMWGEDQWPCLEALWDRESGWNHNATNRFSGAHGIPQSHPGSKMASKGPEWRTDAITQMDWGLHYIRDATTRGGRIKYGTPCKADAFQKARGYY